MTTKITCSKCGETKSTSEFYKDCSNKNGLRAECRDCTKKATKERQMSKKIFFAVCNECGKEKIHTEFHKNKTKRNGIQSICKSCRHAYDNKRRNLAKKQIKTTRNGRIKTHTAIIQKIINDSEGISILGEYQIEKTNLEDLKKRTNILKTCIIPNAKYAETLQLKWNDINDQEEITKFIQDYNNSNENFDINEYLREELEYISGRQLSKELQSENIKIKPQQIGNLLRNADIKIKRMDGLKYYHRDEATKVIKQHINDNNNKKEIKVESNISNNTIPEESKQSEWQIIITEQKTIINDQRALIDHYRALLKEKNRFINVNNNKNVEEDTEQYVGLLNE